MGLDAERDAIFFGHLHQAAQFVDGLDQTGLVAGCAARPAVDDGDAAGDRGLHGRFHHGRIAPGLFDGQQFQIVGLGQPLDLRHDGLPVVQHQMFAHARNRRQFHAVIAGHGQILERGLQIEAAE